MRAHTLGRVWRDPATQSQPASWLRNRIAQQLANAGLTLDGPNPWDPQIHSDRVFRRIALHGTLGAGESYVDGDWDCDSLDELTSRLLSSNEDRHWKSVSPFITRLISSVMNLQSRARARRDIASHYNLGNEFYSAMLGPAMTYSCGYWREAKTLEEAQNAKHELACQKLGLRPGMRVLDIGCGWGEFARYAASRYHVHVVGVTLSQPQAELARRRCADLPVEIQVRDYRDVRESFDRIVSIGMFEHVGPANYRRFFESVRSNLAPNGLLLLHSIGGLRSLRSLDPWMARYIFSHAVLPSSRQILRAAHGLFVLEDWHNFGADYDKTLMAWHANFSAMPDSMRERSGPPQRKNSSPENQGGNRRGNRFERMWRYYLLSCAGSFRARRTQLWQIVFSPSGVPGGYLRPSL